MSSKIPWLKPPSRALIVGINEYDDEKITNLRGCVRDALDVATFLFAELGMSADKIRLLTSPIYLPQPANKLLTRHNLKGFLGEAATTDEERLLTSPAFAKGTLRPTRANIIDGIRNFLGNAKRGEEVLFYYSGHGSTNMLDDKIRFGDEKAETLVPADAGIKLSPDSSNGSFDHNDSLGSINWDVEDFFEEEESSEPQIEETYHILDRELRYLIAQLLEKGIQLTMIADSCHSGGVVRGDHPDEHGQSEPMPRLTLPGYLPRDFNSLLDGQADFQKLEELYNGLTLPYTLIAGCLPTELSYEVKSKDGGYRGAMTSSLLRTLRTLNGPVTYRELGRVLRGSIPDYFNKENQHPNITGFQERLLFSNQTIRRKLPLFAVQKISKKWIELDGGQVEGVNQNSILTCYSDWSLSTPQGEFKVVKSRSNVARAIPLEGSKPVRPTLGQPLLLKQRPDRPTIFFDPTAERIAEAWRQRDEPDSQGRYFQAGFWAHAGVAAASSDEEAPEDKWRDNSSWKGAPYLVEVFNKDADYTAEVENNLLIVKRRDGSIIEALHKQIYDPEVNPSTEIGGMQHHQTPDFLSFLIDRIINYQNFVAKTPTKKNTLDVNFSGEEPEIKIEVELIFAQDSIPLTQNNTLPLPAAPRIRVTLTNQNYKKKNLYLNVYHLDPELYFAERIWPGEGTDQLEHNRSRISTWELSSWQGGLLNLKLIVSTDPLNLEQRPCGDPEWQRGASMSSVRPLKRPFKGWNAYHLVMGLSKKVTYHEGRFA